MIDLTIYHAPTGRIDRVVQSPANAIQHQALADDEAMIFGAFDAETAYVHQGRARNRPALSVIRVDGQGWDFDGVPPEGTVALISSRFIDGEIDLDSQSVVLAVPELAQVQVKAPWPYRELAFELDGSAGTTPEGAQIIPPELGRMKAYFQAAIYEQADALSLQMLGNPSENTQKRWLVKRALFDKFEAGNLSGTDRTALAEEVRYSDETVEEHLAVIGQKIAFQNWVTFRADGLRYEAENRLAQAVTPQDVLGAVAWAEDESAKAVAEAQAMLTA